MLHCIKDVLIVGDLWGEIAFVIAAFGIAIEKREAIEFAHVRQVAAEVTARDARQLETALEEEEGDVFQMELCHFDDICGIEKIREIFT